MQLRQFGPLVAAAFIALAAASCGRYGDASLSQITGTDSFRVDPKSAQLSLSARTSGSLDGGLRSSTATFAAIGLKGDLHPAETGHVRVDIAHCDGSLVADDLSVEIAFVAGPGCAQTSVTHLDCILLIDGSAHFDAVPTQSATTGVRVPVRACSGLCKPPVDACDEAVVEIVQ
jgi:hypothetical protein